MRSFLLFLVVFFIAGCYCQRIAQVDQLYAEFNKSRSALCLTPITIATDLENVAQINANAVCTGSPSNINNYLYYYYTTTSTFTKTDLFNYANGIYQNQKTNWVCSTDTSKGGDVSWQRFVVNPTQEVGCAFNNNNCLNKYTFVCTFRNYPFTTPVVPTSKCSGCGTTTTTTTGSTTTTTGSTTATTKAPVTSAPTTKAPVTAAPTTKAPVTSAPTTKAPVTSAPTTQAPTTQAPTTQAPTTTGDATKDAFLTPINNARLCMGMKALTWNATLASDAQAWADFSAITCNSAHSFSTTNPKRIESDQGENIWAFQGTNLTPLQAIGLGVEFWNKEAIGFVCSTNQCTLSSTPQTVTLSNGYPSNLYSCGHYTQNVWYRTTSIGCAFKQCPGVSPTKILGVCRYNPPGNWNGEHPLGGTANCDKAPGCGAKRSLAITSNQNTQNSQTTPKSTSFFNSESQVVVFALAIAILVVVVAIFVVLLIGVKKRNPSGDYQLMESK